MMKMRYQRAMSEDVHSLFQHGAMGVWADGKLVSHFLSEQAGCEGAFRVLLHRHGPMVLTVCRRVLGDPHAAEDAFQATFLVLVKKASSIRDRDVLTGWLYGVALRVARKAKAQAARRQVVERQAAERPEGTRDDQDRAEIRSLIHEEIGRLPARYREPLLLCYLEGLRHHEIAERLECPVGTVESRLSRGREQLRSRLVRRGLAPTAAVQGAMLMAKDASAAVPNSLVEATIRCASGFASRRAVAKVVATSVASLARASSWPQLGHSLTGLVACAGLVVAGLGAYSSWAPGASPVAPSPARDATTNPAPNPITTPPPIAEAERSPVPTPLPSRPDSAFAVPLEKITIDGRLDDWPEGMIRYPIRRRLVGNSTYDGETPGANAYPEANFRAGYDRATGRIYLAVEVADEDVVASPEDPWHTDAVEVYVDGLFSEKSSPDGALVATRMPVIQYAAVPGPVAAYNDPKGSNPSLLYGKLANSTTEMAHHRQENITTYEWAIQAFDHYPDRPTLLEPGKRIGLEVVVVDMDRDRKKPTWINWGPPVTGFKGLNAASLGELILLDRP
jgi:RNA polymerase sigma factor (sigma-70 family)